MPQIVEYLKGKISTTYIYLKDTEELCLVCH